MNTDTGRTVPAGVLTLPQLFAWRMAATHSPKPTDSSTPTQPPGQASAGPRAGAQAARWTEALARLGLPRGSGIAILLPNGLDAGTGDQAAIGAGRIRILGRLKETMVTSTGEKIAPADLELAITADPLFEMAYVVGDNRPFIACIVVLNPALWTQLAASLQFDPSAAASLQQSTAGEAALKRIRSLTRGFAQYAQPRAVWLTLDVWTTENSLMTPTLKIKRNNLAAHFTAQIEALYQQRLSQSTCFRRCG